jgi:predicted MFS family arabinose efflux permease
MISNLGGMIQSVGAAWQMALLSESHQLVALVQASTSLPIFLFALLAGTLADRSDRRRLMLVAQGLMLICSSLLALMAITGTLEPWSLLLLTFIIGSGAALHLPAWQASVGDMVPRPMLASAIAFNSMGFNLSRSVGPAIGGVLVAGAGAAAAFLVNSLTYLGLFVVIARWRLDVPERMGREPLHHAMRSALGLASSSRPLRIVMLRAAAFGFPASALLALLPLVARDQMLGNALVYGLLLGSFGAGAVVGAAATGALRLRLSTDAIVRLGSFGLAAGTLGASLSNSLFGGLPSLMLSGAAWVTTLATFNTTVQLSAARAVLARSIALYHLAVFGGIAAGSWTFGFIADLWGVSLSLGVAGLALVLSTIAVPARMPSEAEKEGSTP